MQKIAFKRISFYIVHKILFSANMVSARNQIGMLSYFISVLWFMEMDSVLFDGNVRQFWYISFEYNNTDIVLNENSYM